MRRIFISLAIVFFCSAMMSAHALNAYHGFMNDDPSGSDFKFGFTAETAYLSGDSKEMVFDPGFFNAKISELSYELNDLIMGGGSFAFQYKDVFLFNAGYYSEISSGTGVNKDSDWLYFTYIDDVGIISSEKTLFSKSKADLETARQWNINGALKVCSLDGDSISSMIPCISPENGYMSVQALGGFQTTKFAYKARGGNFLVEGQDVLTFDPNLIVLTYEHELDIPYIGAAVQLGDKGYNINLFYLFSHWAEIDAFDQHPLRNLEIDQSFEDGEWFTWGLQVNIDLTKFLSLNISVLHEELKTTQADGLYIDTLTRESTLFASANGTSHVNDSASVGLTFKI